jgi:hypothetical protein
MKQRGCWNFAALGRKFIMEKDGLSFYNLPVKERVTAITKLRTNYQFIWGTLESYGVIGVRGFEKHYFSFIS